MKFLYNIYKYCIDYLFPYRCLQCFCYTQQEDGLCSNCFGNLNFNSSPYCIICGKGFAVSIDQENLCGLCVAIKPFYDNARFIIRYDEKSRKIIQAFKYNDKTIFSKIFSKILYKQHKELIDSADLIVPVPMHRLKRLFIVNHVELGVKIC